MGSSKQRQQSEDFVQVAQASVRGFPDQAESLDSQKQYAGSAASAKQLVADPNLMPDRTSQRPTEVQTTSEDESSELSESGVMSR